MMRNGSRIDLTSANIIIDLLHEYIKNFKIFQNISREAHFLLGKKKRIFLRC